MPVVHVTAFVQQRGTGARDEPARESRHVKVTAASYEDAKRAVLVDLQDGWIVAAWYVNTSDG